MSAIPQPAAVRPHARVRANPSLQAEDASEGSEGTEHTGDNNSLMDEDENSTEEEEEEDQDLDADMEDMDQPADASGEMYPEEPDSEEGSLSEASTLE